MHPSAVSDDAWIGLTNPDRVRCLTTAECTNELYWSDGSLYTEEGRHRGNIQFNNRFFSAS